MSKFPSRARSRTAAAADRRLYQLRKERLEAVESDLNSLLCCYGGYDCSGTLHGRGYPRYAREVIRLCYQRLDAALDLTEGRPPERLAQMTSMLEYAKKMQAHYQTQFLDTGENSEYGSAWLAFRLKAEIEYTKASGQGDDVK